MSERSILITHWGGEAYERLQSERSILITHWGGEAYERLQSERSILITHWGGEAYERLLSERSILITHWGGEAYERLLSEDYNQTRYRCFEKTGCLITADGSNDSKIKPEGLHDYVVPKALPVQVAEDAAECVVPVAAPEPSDVLDSDVDDPFADGERKDEQTDRVYDHIMVKRKVRALYDN